MAVLRLATLKTLSDQRRIAFHLVEKLLAMILDLPPEAKGCSGRRRFLQ